MQILNLKQIPAALEPLAHWHFQQWSYLNPGQTIEQRIEKMQQYLNDDFIPSTFVAVEQQLQGSAAIVACDLPGYEQYSPWLASVFVRQESRGKGIGSQLVKHVMQQAKQQGYEKIYLYTDEQPDFYRKLGWEAVEKLNYLGIDVTIMSVALNKV